MSESFQAGVLDTSVLIDITSLDPEKLPETSVTTAVTLVEHGLPLFTRNPADFAGLGPMVTVVSV